MSTKRPDALQRRCYTCHTQDGGLTMSEPVHGVRPGRLWSLWDMLKAYAHHAMVMGRTAGCVESICAIAASGADRQLVAKLSSQVQEPPSDGPLDPMLLPSFKEHLKRVDRILGSPDRTIGELQQAGVELANRIHDALVDQQFFHVASNMTEFYIGPTLFGAEVEARLPTMSEDIDEAGKCLALGRSTAAVFHLMRVMEIAVQKLGDKLGVLLASEKVWQCILDEVNKAIRAMDPKSPQTKAYAAASAHLYNVKIAWRNEVMHPKQTYSSEEAHNVFDSVRIFIRDLAGLM